MKARSIQLTAVCALLSCSAWAEEENPNFVAKQEGNNIVITSPYGKKIFFAPMGFDANDDYQVSIPLDALKDKGAIASGDPAAVHNFKTDVDALLLQANDSFLASEPKAALGAVEQALDASPNNVRALMMKGSLMHVLGERDMAKKSWQKALALDPANQEIRKVLEKYK
jgi:tetratricopeptide (TPR) repeat protein